MSQVSKRKMGDKDFKKIFDKFIDVLLVSKPKENIQQFVQEFFYKTEQIMLAKRLAIIYMVINGVSSNSIEWALSVSTSTVHRIAAKYYNGDYKYLESILKKKTVKLADLLEEMILFLPPKGGLKRYRLVRERRLSRNN